jgi:Protein of unknown function (DUF3501)
MKLIDRNEVLGLGDYETIRERFRARVIDAKKRRRVALGPQASALFENRDTVLLQIQEILRTERITRAAAIQHELDTYNENLPGDDELSCTVMIEIVDKDEREAFLRAAAGLERHVWLVVDGDRVAARPSERAGAVPERTTAVHYLKFRLPSALAESLRASRVKSMALAVDHPSYTAQADLPRATIAELVEDLNS